MATEVNVEEKTQEQAEEKQAVTIEQLEALQTQLEATRKAQSGSDRTVKELQDLLKQRETEAEESQKSEKQKFDDRLKQLEDAKNEAEQSALAEKQRNLAMQLLNAQGIKAPTFLTRLIGKDDDETTANIEEYIKEKLDDKLAIADSFAKDHGVKIQKGNGDQSMKALGDMTDAEIDAMSDAEFLKVQERSKKR